MRGGGGDHAHEDGSPRLDISRNRRGRDQASNDSRTESNHAVLALVTIVEGAPNNTTKPSSKHGVPNRHDGTHVCTGSAASVET